ncbi:MAG: NUDIX domain-containing protein [Defluviitaleaceae bacterium]|nr:NUDIX domain-containing protein [Defluviitaleaceae bacterium]
MEQFDILDIDGTPTGLTASRGAKLADGQYYLGSHTYIYNSSNEFLLQQRAYTKAFLPGGWDIHMGHVMAGETSKASMVREIEEEIGLIIPEDELTFVGRVIWEQYHHMIDVYFLKIDFDIKKLTLPPEEVIEAKSVCVDEMLALVENMDYRPVEYRRLVAGEICKLRCSI